MGVTTLTQKGQVTIPKKIRDEIGLKSADKLLFEKRGDEIIIKSFKENILDFKGIVKTKKKVKDYGEVRKMVKNKMSREIARSG